LGECTTSLSEVVAEHEKQQHNVPLGSKSSAPVAVLLLEALDLSWQESLEADVLCSVLRCSPSLATLKLRACETIGNEVMLVAASSCPLLMKVNVARCDSVTNRAIVALAECCPLLKDTNVSWSLCEDSGVVAMLEGCLSLTLLSISGCKMITSRGIGEHVVRHTSLMWLDASWVNSISEQVARSLVAERNDNVQAGSTLAPPLEVLDYYGETTSSSS
jgi:hypothetical protein